MDQATSWLAPLLLLPGVALLIVSTAARSGQVHDELHHWLMGERGAKLSAGVVDHMRQRARLFRTALICLYLTVCLLALGGMLGLVTGAAPDLSVALIAIFSGVGILTLIAAAVSLARETLLSLEVIEAHLEELSSK